MASMRMVLGVLTLNDTLRNPHARANAGWTTVAFNIVAEVVGMQAPAPRKHRVLHSYLLSVEIPTDITRRKIYSVLLIASRCARICKSSCRGICLLAFVSDGFPRQDAMSHILVIDDEQSVCRVIEAVLTAAGYTVTTAPDGRSGIEAAEKQDFSVALVDLCMPNLNGIGALAGRRRMEPLLSR